MISMIMVTTSVSDTDEPKQYTAPEKQDEMELKIEELEYKSKFN